MCVDALMDTFTWQMAAWMVGWMSVHPSSELPVLNYQDSTCDGCQWLMPAIWATWEVEIRRIKVQSQSWQIFRETLSLNTQHTKKKKKR
jgi:hypothetical protein